MDGIDLEEGEDIDFFVTTDRQHHKPRLEEHVWGEMSSDFPKRIQISPGNIEIEDAKALHIGVRGWKDPAVDDEEPTTGEERRYTLTVTQADVTSSGESSEDTSEAPSPDHKRCPNCTQWIPARTSYLHESFCLRNNVYCGLCNTVFKRGTESDHWHCEHCNAHGNSPSSRTKHLLTTHTPHKCPSSSCTYTASSLSDLASHRTSVCPSKLILCPFCHLIVPQEGSETPDAEQIISGLTFHELQCGSRTTECNICSRRTRLRDMSLHLKDHELQRLSRPVPKICANPQCCRSPSDANGLGICEVCFGPLYAPGYDPTGSQLRNRVERKLLRQLLAGCRKSWCRSRMCRTGRENLGMMVDNMGTMEALPLVQNRGNELPLCVDESTAKRRELAEALAAESVLDQGGKGGYRTEFCVRAVEAASGDLDRARKWLEREGVRIGER